MDWMTTPEFWLRLGSISVLNLLLSGDNALVIALAVRRLPRRQRIAGQLWGALGAVVLRLIFVGIVSALLRIPFLQCVGGAVLIWIAVKLVRVSPGGEGDVRHGTSLLEAVWIIIVADITMSLDNVLAIAAAAHGDFTLVMFGERAAWLHRPLPIAIGVVVTAAGWWLASGKRAKVPENV